MTVLSTEPPLLPKLTLYPSCHTDLAASLLSLPQQDGIGFCAFMVAVKVFWCLHGNLWKTAVIPHPHSIFPLWFCFALSYPSSGNFWAAFAKSLTLGKEITPDVSASCWLRSKVHLAWCAFSDGCLSDSPGKLLTRAMAVCCNLSPASGNQRYTASDCGSCIPSNHGWWPVRENVMEG